TSSRPRPANDGGLTRFLKRGKSRKGLRPSASSGFHSFGSRLMMLSSTLAFWKRCLSRSRSLPARAAKACQAASSSAPQSGRRAGRPPHHLPPHIAPPSLDQPPPPPPRPGVAAAGDLLEAPRGPPG